jgi:hypothetical protein
MIESIPVSGVDIRKAEVAALEAPFLESVTAVGMTEHEQSGKGTPTADALKMAAIFFLPKCRKIHSAGTSIWIMPDKKIPNKRKGDVRFR